MINIIKSITSNALDNDGISLNMILLIFTLHTLFIILTILNKSIAIDIFPEQWEIAIVNPIPKMQNPSKHEDLRPISFLPLMSKILEKAVCTDD